jgi:sulfur-oxidizing protein SoxZ
MANTIKIRASEKGGETTIKALITHPMETGNRKDSNTGKTIPAHFIQEVVFSFVKVKATVVTPTDPKDDDHVEYSLAGEPEGEVLLAQLSGGISKNPYISVKLLGKSEKDLIKTKSETVPVVSDSAKKGETRKKITLLKDVGYGVMLSWNDNMDNKDSNFAPIK